MPLAPTPPASTPPASAPRRRCEVRTYTPRWRTSALTAERAATPLPAREVPPGVLEPRVAFGRAAPLVLEVGSGHGDAALGYAVAHPHHDVLAVEVHLPGVARMLAAAEEHGIPNLRVHRGDAVPFLAERVRPGGLAAVHLFFPDPWPKRRHAGRRFVRAANLALVGRALEPGGMLRLATDVQGYAGQARRELAAAGWVVEPVDRPAWRPVDGFEAKGLAAGRRVTDLVARWSG
ncbi:MAG TPA: tRNA (guanine(46)-N(7))-methyltransferase TrmB [Dermatophilaceae bacterium]|nr:tRNA (guanine(46)-N(7))-methyltransferase TrmB [Dermatophilaceae bacterium]